MRIKNVTRVKFHKLSQKRRLNKKRSVPIKAFKNFNRIWFIWMYNNTRRENCGKTVKKLLWPSWQAWLPVNEVSPCQNTGVLFSINKGTPLWNFSSVSRTINHCLNLLCSDNGYLRSITKLTLLSSLFSENKDGCWKMLTNQNVILIMAWFRIQQSLSGRTLLTTPMQLL